MTNLLVDRRTILSAFPIAMLALSTGTSASRPAAPTGLTAAAATTPAVPRTGLPRITRSGASLQTGGVTRRFAGANIYWLGLNDNYRVGGVPSAPSLATVNAAFDAALSMGSSIIRAHTAGISFGNTGGWSPAPQTLVSSFSAGAWVYNEAAWVHLDQVIDAAAKKGLYLAVPFTDRWNYYHGGGVTIATMVLGGAATLTDFYTDPRVTAAFDAYLTHWFNRVNTINGLTYKDDPTIAVAETGNELYDAPLAWSVGRAASIKAVAPHVLVASGTAATGLHVADTSKGTGMSDPNIDIVGGHYYGRDRGWLVTDAAAAHAAGKVYWIGEYAWADTPVSGGSWTNDGTRAQWLSLVNDPATRVGMVTMWSLLPAACPDVGIHADGAQMYVPSSGASSADRAEEAAGFADISASNRTVNATATTHAATRSA